MSLRYLIIVPLVVLVLVGCTPVPETPEAQEADVMETNEGTPETTESETLLPLDDDAMMDGEATEMTIDMFPFGYSEMEIMATPGETFQITLTNSGGMHDFDIDELNVDTEVIEEGETNAVSFTIPEDAEPGTEYAYYCSVGNHRAQGMEGTIVVQ